MKLCALDNDTKFHGKKLVNHCAKHGIQIYPAGGKKSWDRKENGYPPRSHDCMPAETEFANAFKEAQLDLERREENRNQKRTMKMWRNAITTTWKNRPIEEIQKLINRQPMIMKKIIEVDGERTGY